MEKYKAIDLFCGIGGTTLGLKQAGFDVISAIDVNEKFLKGYRLNHPEVKVVQEDIREIKIKRYLRLLNIKKGELDLLAGCPPCQGFSMIRAKSKEVKTKDSRNDLVFEYLRFVEGLLPKTIIMENVPGLATDRRMTEVKQELEKLGYSIEYGVKDAADYGVPQRRKRMIMVGSLVEDDINIKAPSINRLTVREALAGLDPVGTSQDEFQNKITNFKPETLKIIKMIKKDGGLRSELPAKYQLKCHLKSGGFKDVYGRMKWDDVAPTITGGCLNPSKGRFIHPEEDRGITPREAATLQGFPADYKFPTDATKGDIGQMIGNAFPPAFTSFYASKLKGTLVLNA